MNEQQKNGNSPVNKNSKNALSIMGVIGGIIGIVSLVFAIFIASPKEINAQINDHETRIKVLETQYKTDIQDIKTWVKSLYDLHLGNRGGTR
jgi:hypothetical protein